MRLTKLSVGLLLAISLGTAAEVLHTMQHCPPSQTLAWAATNIHRKHSKETLTKWAAWRKEHPNWKPKTTSETLAAFNWACLDTNSIELEDSVPLATFDESIPALIYPKYESPPLVPVDIQDAIPKDFVPDLYYPADVPTDYSEPIYAPVAGGGFGGWLGSGAPIGPIGTPPPAQYPPGPPRTPAVPEPSYLGILLFGFAGLIKLYRK